MKLSKVAVLVSLMIAGSAMAQSFSIGGGNRSGAGSIGVSPYGITIGGANRNGGGSVTIDNTPSYGYGQPVYSQPMGYGAPRYGQQMAPVYRNPQHSEYAYAERYNRIAPQTIIVQ